ncbi:hypothetical protein DL240_00815 [Lujinxingia litoralis]|uniref:Uncharacterized protein n=1 Tax=Lujinxingia litoralis TaxID=2211119 RepID=A0A328CAI2_9DELT|nr:hypothetical protein [Lujinxingia litoralis]RAL24784.1 hypothetical protein DL240_00815 [Lujinxingia litoralis]
MSASRGWSWVLVAMLAGGWVGCETPRSGETSSVRGGEEAQVARLMESAQVVARAAELRDRGYGGEVEVVRGESVAPGRGLGEGIEEERARLSQALFGDAEALQLSVDRGWSSRAEARAGEQGAMRVIQEGDGEVSRWASAMASSVALESQVFGALETAGSVDGWLAQQVVRSAGPMFASTLALAEAQGMELDGALLARRPDLAERVAGVNEVMAAGEGASVERALGALVMREALGLAAALYRAQGWGGVEWGRVEGSGQSVDVVRPDRWMGGDGEAVWQWPEAFEAVQQARRWELIGQGRVGPLLTSVWLEEVLDARGARSIFGAWLADSYRVYRSPGGGEEGFVWLSAWRTPHEAQQVAAAMEQALVARQGEGAGARTRVAVQGLHVALTSYTEAQDPGHLDDEVKALAGAALAFLPEEPAPLRFVPTTYERYVEAAQEARLEGERWQDPASGWTMSLEALDGWQVQKSDEVHVRWFATHEDGALAQWTTELVDPLGAAFGSDDYVAGLKEAFARSVQGSEPEVQVSAEGEGGPRVSLAATGEIDGRAIELQLWQWERGEVLTSYSVQAPADGVGERLAEVALALESLELYGEALVPERERGEAEGGAAGGAEGRGAEAEGILEFRVEEE